MAVRHHKEYYAADAGPSPETATTSGMGTAAAMQALKLFVKGDEDAPPAQQQPPQNQSQSAFIGLAMSQAAKLFDQQASAGNVPSESGADKQSAVMKAGEMALRMYLKSQGSGGAAASGDNLSGLMTMASRFM